MLYISGIEALTGWGKIHLVTKERSYALSAIILNIWQMSVQTLFATDTVEVGTNPITVPK